MKWLINNVFVFDERNHRKREAPLDVHNCITKLLFFIIISTLNGEGETM